MLKDNLSGLFVICCALMLVSGGLISIDMIYFMVGKVSSVFILDAVIIGGSIWLTYKVHGLLKE